MLSRDADSCFWIGRYVERAEATARMVDVHYHSSLDAGRTVMHWNSLLMITGDSERYLSRYRAENDRDALYFFALDSENPDSILRLWTAARENARTIREQISSEMWEALNVGYLALREPGRRQELEEAPHAFFQSVKNQSHLFQGILNRTLIMGEARDWLDAGRFLERASQTARILDVKYHDLLPAAAGQTQSQDALGVGSLLDTHGWMAVLRSVSAFEMFRKTHRDGILPANVVDFLVLNPSFPASVRHGVARVEGCLRRISGNRSDQPATEPERLAGRLRADLTFIRADEILARGLHQFLEDGLERLDALGGAIARTYLAY